MHNRRHILFTFYHNMCLLCILLFPITVHATILVSTQENIPTYTKQSIEYTTQDDIFVKELSLSEKIRYFDLLLLQTISDFDYDINVLSLLSTQRRIYRNSWYFYQEFTISGTISKTFLQEIVELEQIYPKSFSINNVGNTHIKVFIDGIITHTIYIPNVPPKNAQQTDTYMTIIIDDIGENIDTVKQLLQLPFSMTYALWPFSSKTQASMNLLKKHKQEMIIHMPMEPDGYPKIHSGKGTLLSTMKGRILHRHIKKAIEAVPHAIGMNNHMGSKATQSTNFVISLIQYIKQEYPEFIIVDSVTHPRSILHSTARKMNVLTAKRHVFLDHERTREHTLKQLKETERLSKKYGKALAIGHPAPTTIAALQCWSKTRNTTIKIISLKKFITKSQ
ncbi:MAG: divergent polysaccharide deacetylase family protein [Desulfovibrionaceae bacterium]